jgi:class 3 adenylate cyclase
MNHQPSILIVEDNQVNRHLLSRMLQQDGHRVRVAEDGREAVDMMLEYHPDLVLLDIMMPNMDGYEVLGYVKSHDMLRHIPIVVISAIDDLTSVVKCIELGAEDYLFKPFNPVLLKARIDASMEKKRLRDHEQAYFKQLVEEQQKSERLLLNILPEPVARRLKQGEHTIADCFADVTVLFADIVGFTQLSNIRSPDELIELLNTIFSQFDVLTEQHGLEKIKTVGDSYMIAGGLPIPCPNHVQAVADVALDMQEEIVRFCMERGESFNIRIGMHTGPVVAGVIGRKKFSYDLWGDTVNIASRMESHGVAGGIQVTETTYQRLQTDYRFQERGLIDVKGKGALKTYWLIGKRHDDV